LTKSERRRRANARSIHSDLDVGVTVAPDEWDAGEPVFGVDGAADADAIFGRQNAGAGGEFLAGDLSSDGAGSNFDFRVIADALDLAELGVGHDVELVVDFGKPDGGADRDSGFAEGGEGNVAFPANFGGDGHRDIVNKVWTE